MTKIWNIFMSDWGNIIEDSKYFFSKSVLVLEMVYVINKAYLSSCAC